MRKILLLLVLSLCLAFWGCSSDGDDGGTNVSPEDQAAADQAATESMGGMMEDMEDAVGGTFDPEDMDAIMAMDMTTYQEDFEAALALDPNCGAAHFGLAFVQMVLLAQASGLEDLTGMLGEPDLTLPGGMTLPGHSPLDLLAGGLLGRSFTIMHRAPLAMVPQEVPLGVDAGAKDGTAIVRDLQTTIHDTLLPMTGSIVGHLGAAEADPDFQILIIQGAEPDTVEIDLGEVYVLDGVVRALRSGLYLATAYDVEPSPDGDYTWLTDPLLQSGFTSYEYDPVGDGTYELTLYDDEEESLLLQDAMLGHIEGLLSSGSHFLTLWTDPWSGEDALSAAHGEMQALLAKLEAAYGFIQAEQDDQDHDLIAQMLLAELDGAILEMGGDLPEHMGTWETLPDIIAWVRTLTNGPYTIPVVVGPEETFDLTVDISSFFLDPVPDWKTKLPYMEWLDFAQYATYDGTYTYGPNLWNPDFPYTTVVNGQDMEFTDVISVTEVDIYWDSETPLVFLDGPDGNPIPEGDFLYLPDYTFGGLFPSMTRTDWMTLLGVDPR